MYFILAIVGLVCAVGWWMNRVPKDERDDVGLLTALRRRRLAAKHVFALGLLVVILVAGGAWLLDRLVVTDSKRIIAVVEDMAAAVRQKDPDRIVAHLSDDFHYGSRTKKDFGHYAAPYIRSGMVTDVVVWDFDTQDVSRETRKGFVLFTFKLKGPELANDAGYRCWAEFVLDKDDQWRLKTFKLALPMKDPRKEPVEPPYFH